MRTVMATAIRIPTIMADDGGIRAALRLQSWLSPAFPVGAYSYSHGIEAAIEADLVRDAATLEDWIGGLLRFGTGRSDAILLSEASRLAAADDKAGLAELSQFALALIPTSELRLEATAQGAAFLKTVAAAWPDVRVLSLPPAPPLAIAYGTVTAASGIALDLAGPLFLQAFVHNVVSAAVRAVPLGQTDGQRVIAGLEELVERVWEESRGCGVEDIGTASLMAEWSSLQHEAMDGRLFRS